jgi:hypothetical protein
VLPDRHAAAGFGPRLSVAFVLLVLVVIAFVLLAVDLAQHLVVLGAWLPLGWIVLPGLVLAFLPISRI